MEYPEFLAKLAQILRISPEGLDGVALETVSGFDSVARLEIVMLVEEGFGWLMSQEGIQGSLTPRELWEHARSQQF